MGRIGLPGIALLALVIVMGCGVSEPPLPSVPLPIPSAARAAPSATPAATTTAPASTIVPTSPTSTAEGVTLTIIVAPTSPDRPDYDRGDWRHWIDADRDCQDARQEVLIAESLTGVAYEAGDTCRVERGDWFGVYTGESFTDPSDLDVDHMVPLANADRSGGWAWSRGHVNMCVNVIRRQPSLVSVQRRFRPCRRHPGRRPSSVPAPSASGTCSPPPAASSRSQLSPCPPS